MEFFRTDVGKMSTLESLPEFLWYILFHFSTDYIKMYIDGGVDNGQTDC